MSQKKHKRKPKGAHEYTHCEAARVLAQNRKVVAPEKQPETTKATDSERQDEKENPMGFGEAVKRSSFTDWCLSAFTLALAVVAIYQFVVTNSQLDVMRNDERAWLKLEGQPGEVKYTSGQPVSYPIQITNIGKTAAIDVEIKIFTNILDASEPVPLERVTGAKVNSPYPFNDFTTGVIFPDSTIKQTAVRPEKGGGYDVGTAQEMTALQGGKSYLSIYGIVTYADVFKVHHWVRFCEWKYFGTGPTTTKTCSSFNELGDGEPYD